MDPLWIVCAQDEGAPAVVGPYFDAAERDYELNNINDATNTARQNGNPAPFRCECFVHFATNQQPPPGCVIYDVYNDIAVLDWLHANAVRDDTGRYRIKGGAPVRSEANALVVG